MLFVDKIRLKQIKRNYIQVEYKQSSVDNMNKAPHRQYSVLAKCHWQNICAAELHLSS